MFIPQSMPVALCNISFHFVKVNGVTVSQDVDSEINRLKDHFQVESDVDLASSLGIRSSAISAWRSRGNVRRGYRNATSGGYGFKLPYTGMREWEDDEWAAYKLAMLRWLVKQRYTMLKDFGECLRDVNFLPVEMQHLIDLALVDVRSELDKAAEPHSKEATTAALASIIQREFFSG